MEYDYRFPPPNDVIPSVDAPSSPTEEPLGYWSTTTDIRPKDAFLSPRESRDDSITSLGSVSSSPRGHRRLRSVVSTGSAYSDNFYEANLASQLNRNYKFASLKESSKERHVSLTSLPEVEDFDQSVKTVKVPSDWKETGPRIIYKATSPTEAVVDLNEIIRQGSV